MKKLIFIGLTLLMTMSTIILKSQNNMTQEEQISYALGAMNGQQFVEAGITILPAKYMEGIKDGMAGANKFSEEEMQQIFQLINQMVQANQSKAGDAEKQKGEAFLADNLKNNPGVKATPSGLQYKVITMGKGPKPTATDKVKVHYHGTTIDGVVFDSSVQRGEPIVFGLNQVIKGWTEGLQLMPVGSKFIFYIPADLAYGDRGAGGAIKPGAALIFEVELFEINPAE
ncbi:MAG: FKBP-type peptidyl-prolyl cis-trans isomerase [Bacteroidales bacterium]|jgi:FKBP-type peptidyl-prolyl cis-trans isomerase|nr:FKBP-type peptidyl-prolyl cis-trans isomerase [Bacteroidales bacterium]